MADEEARREAALDERQKLCTQMVSVRTSLYSIIIVLNQVKPTQSVAKAQMKKHEWELDQEFIDELYYRKKGPMSAPEANAMAMLKNVFMKVGVLLNQLQAEGAEVPDQQVLMTRALLPDVIAARRQRADQTEEEIGVLMHSADTIGDAKVPTRDSIKVESAKIIRMARKLNEAESFNDRAKRVRRDEKWV
ncbi:uncharacterized protein LOC113216758 [Frankliniella occidentalis]|uniref:Uncharacterized protein LOC113216758 n=1 Tax=Frankliniella occidentalis TaxID=133901 RepID=A0A9C6XBX6_FRAOC|nr:uncharacterized protein LOC113216758 [Frankliniella occidentalis]